MKKLLFFLIAIAFLSNSIEAQNGKLLRKVVEKRLDRDSVPNTGPAPDYSDLQNWAASPFKDDTSDSIPAFLKNETSKKRADVFFIHPTSYFGEEDTSPWNADLRDTAVNNNTDNLSILLQTTVFNGSCRVFAPRYRQGNMEAFYVFDTPEAKAAFDLAYSDVKKAFLYFLKHYNKKRPIIIASHSQGSLHAIRLLQEFFDGKPLQKQLVCAYIVGYQIKKDAFRKLPVGERPDQTGCFVGWRTYAKGEIPKGIAEENGNSVCVNPLTWTTSEQSASPELHLGIMSNFETIVPHTVGAGIEPSSKILWINTQVVLDEKKKAIKNYHVWDYNLFWMNIRQNVKERIDAYLK
ncbi:MAG: DUF3089 domain-containing protein [Bacteroidota bacterium]|nr:DUF3089 domain-containing protein [Bacteroidota bacterium]